MHTITLVPQRREAPVTARIDGDTLTVGAEQIDLTAPGDTDWIVGTPERESGGWAVTLVLPVGSNPPIESRFPVPVTLPGDGVIPLPPYDVQEDDEDGAG